MVSAVITALEKNGPIYTMGKYVVAPASIDLLASAYLQMKIDGTLKVFYYEGDPGLAKFLEVHCNPNSVTYGCYLKTGDKTQLVGIGHISAPAHIGNGFKKAELSCFFFQEYQHRDITVPLSQMMLEQTFERYPEIDFLFGATPEKNRAMLMFMTGLGFGHTSHPIPNYTTWEGDPCGVYIVWMSKEMWERLSPFRVVDSD